MGEAAVVWKGFLKMKKVSKDSNKQLMLMYN